MNTSHNAASPVSTAVDIATRIGVLAAVLLFCYQILRPFISPVVWGIILAVSVYPLFQSLGARLGGRRKLAAGLLTVSALLVIILPGIRLSVSSVEGLRGATAKLEGQVRIPPPPDRVREWPIIGKRVYSVWQQASVNLENTLERFEPQVRASAEWLLQTAVDTIFGVLMFAVSLIIAGLLLATSDSGGQLAKRVFIRLAGERGSEFAAIAEKTIQSVVKGILGVAVIQSLMAGVGFAVAGIPGAGIWAFLCLFLAIVQVGIGPVVLGVVIYAFSKMATLPAVVLTVYLIILTLADGPMKAILLGRGAQVPMAVIFLGSIGGFIWIGFLGLFIGAVVLSLGYKLFEAWIGTASESQQGSDAEDVI